ncbi:MAG: SDR family oxidoreductase [Candidatus Lokiarchaeota archaeon]|nr:SDR family oxidoreductase [Candidatus Harpocratesius repetitus]
MKSDKINRAKKNKIQFPLKVLITGASGGIGNAIAKKLAQSPEKYEVYGTSRFPKKIPQELHIPNLKFYSLDLTQASSIESLLKKLPKVDILINNAGCSHNGPVEEIPMERVREYFELNFFGLVSLIRGYLPSMRTQEFGYIINVSSIASLSPVPFSSFYAASKAAVNALTFGLANEIHNFGIKAIVVAPFEIKTDLPQDFQTKKSSQYYSASKAVKNSRDHGLLHGPSPEVVAEAIWKILHSRNPKLFYPVGKNAKIKYFLIKHLPRRIISNQTRKIFHIS